MTRKLRKQIIFPGALYHVVCRGVNEKNIFRHPRDYRKILKILRNAKERYKFYLHSYSLMTNHFHLQIRVNDTPIFKIMHYVNTCYSMYFNWQYNRSGHLFQDRYYASLINTESYFWIVSAYIDLNPVRAKLVERPEDYQWGSYRLYFQRDYNNDLVNCIDFLESRGDGDLDTLCSDYLEFVNTESQKPKSPKFIKGDKFI